MVAKVVHLPGKIGQGDAKRGKRMTWAPDSFVCPVCQCVQQPYLLLWAKVNFSCQDGNCTSCQVPWRSEPQVPWQYPLLIVRWFFCYILWCEWTPLPDLEPGPLNQKSPKSRRWETPSLQWVTGSNSNWSHVTTASHYQTLGLAELGLGSANQDGSGLHALLLFHSHLFL